VLTALAQIETAQLHRIRVLEAEELGSRLSGEPRKPIDRDRFKELMRRRPPESIEEMLDRAASNETLFVRFCYVVERLFYLVGWDIDWVALDAFLARRFSLADTQHIFVSFNYDLFLDRAVQRAFASWHPASGYGFCIPYRVEPACPAEQFQLNSAQIAVPLEYNKESSVLILKPHGSLNWLLPLQMPVHSCSSTGFKLEDGPCAVALTADGELSYWSASGTFRWIEWPGAHPSDSTPLIVTPTLNKDFEHPICLESLRRETEAVQQADEIFVIGWSMPASDTDHGEILRSAVASRTGPFRRLTVVNRGADDTYFGRVAAVFESRCFVKFNDGFSDFAVRNQSEP